MSRPAEQDHHAAGIAPEDVAAAVPLARRVYRMRGLRNGLLGEDLFSEPTWDMLLDLFIAEAENRRLSVGALLLGSRAAPTTALRYLKLLEDRALVERTADERDGRRSFLRLSRRGIDQVARAVLCLAEPGGR